jgi:cyclophilin family peptidyl-prolyl cis-trans isomerase/HEAT repeat protein
MLPFVLAALLQAPAQVPTHRQLLEAEHARADNAGVLARGAASGNPELQRVALRALGRLERPENAAIVTRYTTASNPSVRREAINALGQMRAPTNFALLLPVERDVTVRAAIFETLGRTTAADTAAERQLAQGLGEGSPIARAGAARGLESYVRRHVRTARPSATTLAAMRRTFVIDTVGETRQLLLLALNAAGDRDSTLLHSALRDRNEQVRRLAVAGLRQWVDDPSPMVRYQALRVAGDCARATAALRDTSEHVALAAIDLLGERRCDAAIIESQVQSGRTWRMRARALVSLARVAPLRAKSNMMAVYGLPQWQARTYVAAAARLAGDSATLVKLAVDREPNVVASALSRPIDARRALTSSHAGLLLESVAFLQKAGEIRAALPDLAETLRRLSSSGNVTYRDVRVAILDRIGELTNDSSTVPLLRTLVGDADPEVATRAARIVSARTGTTIVPRTTRYTPAPLPPEAFMRALEGARAEIRFRGQAPVMIELLPNEAAVTVATFAQLADAGKFNGLTIHRIVPNFVIQGGSPGANEYDALTSTFMRDELGFARNARGTFGISTRGRDTGDGQIYVNLIDNFRLDHDYTVFARVISGLSVIDRIQEGDVIESVKILRSSASSSR